MSEDRYVEIEVEEIVHETPLAFLVSVDGEEHWIPKSKVDQEDDHAKGDDQGDRAEEDRVPAHGVAQR